MGNTNRFVFGIIDVTDNLVLSLPRTQKRSSRFESNWSDFFSALGIIGKTKRKTLAPRVLCVNAKGAHGPLRNTRSRVFRFPNT